MHFLIVDDNSLLNRFLTLFLHSKGHSATALTDGDAVEGWLEENLADAVILDVGMPHVDGLTLVSRIRERHCSVPIVMFTGLGYDEETMQAAHRAGANGYVSKGLGPNEMYLALMRAAQGHAMAQTA